MSEKDELVVVAGADGFIGGCLVADLRRQGYKRIRAVGVQPFEQWNQYFSDVEKLQLDLTDRQNCETAVRNAYQVFMLASVKGGSGFTEKHRVKCMLSVLITTHMLVAAQKHSVQKYFYASSASVYNVSKQRDSDSAALPESHRGKVGRFYVGRLSSRLDLGGSSLTPKILCSTWQAIHAELPV